MASAGKILGSAVTFALVGAGALGAAASPAQAAGAKVLWAAPDGHGGACTARNPCSLAGAQAAVRAVERGRGPADVRVELLGGTYRLSTTWQLGAQDSGSPGHPVVWQAAPGARPVIAGSTRVSDWHQVGSSGVWAARVPHGSATRQLYVDGKEAPIAQATPAALHFSGNWAGSSTGYDLSADPTARAWFAGLTAAQLAQVEFDYPAGNGAWTDSRCGVARMSGSTLVMDQPCWTNVTDIAPFSQGTGGLPSMPTSQLPATVQGARSLLTSGQWFLDTSTDTLYYAAGKGRRMTGSDVELPRLEKLVQGAGSLAEPLHDITFAGLQFSYATWNAPSSAAGFADVQSNLRRTGANNQGLCGFSDPAGTCPWGALTQPLANVAFSGASRVTLTGNRFVDLGGAGLSLMYGGTHNVVDANEFTAIASTALSLGCTYDPTPTVTPASVIEANCTPDPKAVRGDRVGDNEILDHTTVSDNVIHDIGTDYRSACGITLLFSRHTVISHNELYDLPYTGITAGVIQGHVDEADHPQNSTNINADNTISDNLIFDVMQVLDDGGAIYMEGHQAQYVDGADGTIDAAATLANGLHVTDNVVYNDGSRFNAFYDDAGSEWIGFSGNVEFHPLTSIGAQGGCSATGHFWVTGNYFSDPAGSYICTAPVDSNVSGNTVIPAAPGPDDIPVALLANAGVTGGHRALAAAVPLRTSYVSAPRPAAAGSSTDRVLIAGAGFSAATPVYFGGQRASEVRFVSTGFLIATVPAGADGTDVTVGPYVPRPVITAPAGGTTGLAAGYPVRGTAVAGNTVTVTDGTDQASCTATAATDGTWSCTLTGSSAGQHSLSAVQTDRNAVTSKASPAVLVYVGTPPAAARVNDTDPSIGYDNWDYLDSRGYGDLDDDVHYATADGSSFTATFIGTRITVFGEEYTDQGDISVSIDGGPATVVDTVPADGARHADVAVYTGAALPAGVHTITVTKLSGSYATFDGFEIDNPASR
ncbi:MULTISPECIES: Ig-like domain-containing protein [unclassified Streptomyces]|uniref:Ig-like domain-containing protein n=1 Tax=unclassified Streptomyces TaxID=2593676 RepID=UPI000B81753F|nr:MULTISPECIES: Ig-like domain-containing protein [unclassified Streptomyces]MYS20272.1 Ig-like domain repeat protein [Streptomyces sp. SID4948]